MDLTYATIVVLASMIFVLSGMIGYLYWQQTKIIQNLQHLALAVATHLTPPQYEEDDRVSVKEEEPVPESPPETSAESPPESPPESSAEKEDVEIVEGPKDEDIDDLSDKTASELRDILTRKGIPFGKRDSKSILISLIKATS